MTGPDKPLSNHPMASDVKPPLTDRTLKYGRNVIAISSVIIVLAFVPNIELDGFRPFGLKISEDGERSIWGVLGIVLIYYAFSFGVAAVIDVRAWKWANISALTEMDKDRRLIRGHVRANQKPHELTTMRSDYRQQFGDLHDYLLRLWWLDIGVPVVMFVIAIIALSPLPALAIIKFIILSFSLLF